MFSIRLIQACHRASIARTTAQFRDFSPSVNAQIWKRWAHDDTPIKFTTSSAHVNYKAGVTFRKYDEHAEPDAPESRNLAIAIPMILAAAYVFLFRDHTENDGGKNLLVPLHEQFPEMAIPFLESALKECISSGQDTSKIRAKLKELKKDPKRYGGEEPTKIKPIED